MPESTGIPTLGDVLMWCAEQGAFARSCRLPEQEWNPRAVDRVREVTIRSAQAPAELRETVRTDPASFIDFVMSSDNASGKLACLNDQLFMVLDHLIGNYGFPVGQALDAPLHPHTDLQYVCRQDLQIDPPSWALNYLEPDNTVLPVSIVRDNCP